MSGGSMNYLYRRILWESDFQDSTELRKEFRLHLIQVAAALKAIEWVDSGDMSPGDEDEAIDQVLGSTRCSCGEMPKHKCPGEWEPGCDLGNNPKYAKRVDRPQRMRDSGYTRRPTIREMREPEVANQCGETCERAKLCATCARGLEKPEQEPVAWMGTSGVGETIVCKKRIFSFLSTPLYTHPKRRSWQGLTEKEVFKCLPPEEDEMAFYRAIEAELKEINHD